MDEIFNIFAQQDIGHIIYLTLKIALISTIITLLVGFILAYVLAFKNFWGKEFLDILVQFPLIVPPSILGYYLLVLFSRNGWLGKILQKYFGLSIIFTWYGALIAAMVVSIPFMVRTIKSDLESIDRSIIEAAKIDQATEVQILGYILLPMARKGIVAGILLSFTRAMGEFGATLMIAGNIPGKTQTMSLAIYQAAASGNFVKANILVIILTLICFSILWIIKVKFKVKI